MLFCHTIMVCFNLTRQVTCRPFYFFSCSENTYWGHVDSTEWTEPIFTETSGFQPRLPLGISWRIFLKFCFWVSRLYRFSFNWPEICKSFSTLFLYTAKIKNMTVNRIFFFVIYFTDIWACWRTRNSNNPDLAVLWFITLCFHLQLKMTK